MLIQLVVLKLAWTSLNPGDNKILFAYLTLYLSKIFYLLFHLIHYECNILNVYVLFCLSLIMAILLFSCKQTMALLLIGLDIVQWISGKVPSRPLSDMEFSGNIGIRVTILINQSGKKLVEYSWKYWVLSVWTYLNI